MVQTHKPSTHKPWDSKPQTQHTITYLNSATGVKRRVIMAASPGIRGSMVVSRAIIEDPPGFKPTNPAHSNLPELSHWCEEKGYNDSQSWYKR